jgi:arylsulfatase A-like enzyme
MRRLAWLSLLVLAGCSPPAPGPPPARGVIVVTFDALRADRLHTYGYEKETSPFLDELAARGVVFESAAVHYPATLVSNLSLFTGLYPAEHGVYPPSGVLSAEIETLPEVFRAAGFRTAGHTEGGFMAGGYGFARGFEQFTDTPYAEESDVERTFGRGLEFLRSLQPGERFFLFLHTFVTHDPYEPPAEYCEELGCAPLAAEAPPPTGPTLRAFNAGEMTLSPETIAAYSERYDASIRYADDALRDFWGEVEALDLADETALVVTSDHGEEFADHGHMGHTQVFPETLFVPLVVVPPAAGKSSAEWARGRRVSALAENVRVAPTLLRLAGVDPPPQISRPSLMPYLGATALAGEPAEPGAGIRAAYAEVRDELTVRSLLAETEAGRFQLRVSETPADPEGTWISRSVSFDHLGERLDLSVQSFHEPRQLRIESDGVLIAETEIATSWATIDLELPAEQRLHHITLSTESCASPVELGISDDGRCLSFQVREVALRRIELYNLAADPTAWRDVAPEHPDLVSMLLRRLARYRFEPVAPAGSQEVPAEVRETLRALGYVE